MTAFAPGSRYEIQKVAAERGFRQLDLTYNGRYHINDRLVGHTARDLSEKSACWALCSMYGMTPVQADRITAKARSEKRAQVSMNFPDMPEPTGMTEYGVPMQTNQVNVGRSETHSPDMQNSKDPWFTSEDPGVMLPEQSLEMAGQASQLGQRHLFDHATIGGLSKIYDVGAMIDQLIPKLKTAQDALGRLLFLGQWKHDDFEDRFGPDDASELTDLLRNVFRSYGDLILRLETRSVSDQERVDPLARA